MGLFRDMILRCNKCERLKSWPCDVGDKCMCGGVLEALFLIGDTLTDENGNTGQVTIRWDDGDICHFINDTNHQGAVVIGNINE